jgi:periplasmic protein TonB
MFIRIGLSIILGSAVTFVLLFLMQTMVASDRAGDRYVMRHEITRLTRVERDGEVEALAERPPRPPAPERPPERPSFDLESAAGGSLGVSVNEPTISTDVSVSANRLVASDGEYLPIVTVAPSYPRRALASRLEGYVLVEFIVTTNGTVRDVIVLESSASIFEDAAVEAALKFKFKPRVVDGEPVEVRGVKNRIVFKLEA